MWILVAALKTFSQDLIEKQCVDSCYSCCPATILSSLSTLVVSVLVCGTKIYAAMSTYLVRQGCGWCLLKICQYVLQK